MYVKTGGRIGCVAQFLDGSTSVRWYLFSGNDIYLSDVFMYALGSIVYSPNILVVPSPRFKIWNVISCYALNQHIFYLGRR